MIRRVLGTSLVLFGMGCGSTPTIVNTSNLGAAVDDVQEISETVEETVEQSSACEKLRTPLVAVAEENAIGGAVAVNIVGNNGGLMIAERARSPIGKLNAYINTVGKNLAAQSDRPSLDWTFGVLDTEDVNAYSAPGGYILVTKGLLAVIDNEAQLAGVLAHEIAHVTERHALVLYGAIKANQCQTTLAADAAGDMVSGLTGFQGALESPVGYLDLNDVANLDVLTKMTDKLVDLITTSGFAIEDELIADERASELVLRAGYDPRAFADFLAKIPEESPTHPKNADRQERLAGWATTQQESEDPFMPKPDDPSLQTIPIRRQLRPVK